MQPHKKPRASSPNGPNSPGSTNGGLTPVPGAKDDSREREGVDVLRDSRLNKFTAFSHEERARLGLKGLLPHVEETLEKQVRRELAVVRRKHTPLDKYEHLQQLAQRNSTLFFTLLMENVEELMPIVYTPVVGEACTKFSQIYVSAPQGLYITINDLGNVEKILRNWPEKNIRAIVVTDGERILGLGDLGANGMGIPIGKLQLYIACGGINPAHTLPVTLDVGTNNTALREEEFYVGCRQPRERGAKYDQLVEEFMHAVKKCYGTHCLVQFEDFGNTTAFDILHRYRDNYCCFNDDIQGTASVTLAGVLSSLRVTSRLEGGAKTLDEHTYVFYGAGEAGVGIAELIADAIARETGKPKAMCRQRIWLVDSTGLICTEREDQLAHHKEPFNHQIVSEEAKAALETKEQRADLANVVRTLKATCLIGVSAQPSTFTKEVCEAMCANAERPVIFALSNPTHKCEVTAKDAVEWTNGKCIFATGSPFDDVVRPDGSRVKVGQANNAYIFPGLALGILAVNVRVSSTMGWPGGLSVLGEGTDAMKTERPASGGSGRAARGGGARPGRRGLRGGPRDGIPLPPPAGDQEGLDEDRRQGGREGLRPLLRLARPQARGYPCPRGAMRLQTKLCDDRIVMDGSIYVLFMRVSSSRRGRCLFFVAETDRER